MQHPHAHLYEPVAAAAVAALVVVVVEAATLSGRKTRHLHRRLAEIDDLSNTKDALGDVMAGLMPSISR